MSRYQQTRTMDCRPRRRAGQRGAALLVALILLVVITVVGLAAIGATILQNKAAANQYDRQIAFQAAEAALRQGQVAIQKAAATQPAPAGFEDCSAPLIPGTPPSYGTPVNVCLDNPFSDPNKNVVVTTVPPSAFSAGPLAATKPQYVVQYLGQFLAPTPQVKLISNPPSYGSGVQGQLSDYYRITARSGDPTKTGNRSIVTLQSTFRN